MTDEPQVQHEEVEVDPIRFQPAQRLLDRHHHMPPRQPRAEQRTRFFDEYRSYVINYNLGKDLVKQHIEARAGGDGLRRWSEFVRLLGSPRLPSGLGG